MPLQYSPYCIAKEPLLQRNIGYIAPQYGLFCDAIWLISFSDTVLSDFFPHILASPVWASAPSVEQVQVSLSRCFLMSFSSSRTPISVSSTCCVRSDPSRFW